MINLSINGRDVQIKEGKTILEAAELAGEKIPTLCYIKDLLPTGACRMCVVEVEGRPSLMPSCAYPAEEGMKVSTHTPKVMNARKTIVQLLLANHPFDCLACNRNLSCELQKLASEYNIESIPFKGKKRKHYVDFSSPAIVRNPDKCILCGRCVRICEEIQGVSAIDFTKRGFNTKVIPPFNKGLSETSCVNCGQCILSCPTGALCEVSSVEKVINEVRDKKKYLVAQVAPAIRVSLGDFYGLPTGSNITGKIASVLRDIGFDKIYDTDFTADLTIMEEGTELVDRIKSGGTLPLITSCCPGWIKFAEHNFSDMLPNLSSCKSPQQMMGPLVKEIMAKKEGIKREDIFLISIMPCTAKKFEASRPELAKNDNPDVDVVLTTREFSRLINYYGIDFANLPEHEFDSPIGSTSGSGDIFAASGGVMESALRTAYNLITNKDLQEIDFKDVRGFKNLKEATVDIDGLELKIAVVNTLSMAREVMEKIRSKELDYHFIEIMACPGGCVGGGGQIYGFETERTKKRIKAIYKLDKEREIRRSYKNKDIANLYKEELEKPGSPIAHKLLHTTYTVRKRGK